MNTTISDGADRIRCALVTGASGFIGTALCLHLRENGVRVRALMRVARKGPWEEAVTADLRGGLPSDALRGIDTVFHLAGRAHALNETLQDEAEYFAINTEGSRKLLEAAEAEGVQRFILFSSVKAMGEGGAVCLDESFNGLPVTPYGRSKAEAERLVMESSRIPYPTVLRLSMVYGPTDKGNLPRMIDAIARGRFPPMADLGNRRSMVHVDDVVQAAMLAAEKPQPVPDVYIVTDRQAYSTRQMYEWICEATNRSPSKLVIPYGALTLLAKTGDSIGWLRRRRFMFDSDALAKLTGSAWYSSEKITRELGFRPRRNLRESLPEIAAWLGNR